MTRDDIIRMAREAGMEIWRNGHRYMDEFDIYEFAALVAAAEREAILQMSAATWFKTQADYDAAIRARGQDPMPLFDDWGKDWK
jgi:hypothetical protein